MFSKKKKTSKPSIIPVRPSPPADEEIIRDISIAPDDDVVFTTVLKDEDEFHDAEASELWDSDLEFEDALEETEENIQRRFEKICRFVEINKTLLKEQENMKDSCLRLKESCDEINRNTTELENKLKEGKESAELSVET
uniref:UPF0449 protein C19orf25 homolog n=1 Tax=Phallusia mammillata TaxID=59560 RepID=A0A6F9D7D7_9ASCI|nr:UPF0449 protein C19orf25 homolog [Phallusia mammillata]